jgi:hypothetical protein
VTEVVQSGFLRPSTPTSVTPLPAVVDRQGSLLLATTAGADELTYEIRGGGGMPNGFGTSSGSADIGLEGGFAGVRNDFTAAPGPTFDVQRISYWGFVVATQPSPGVALGAPDPRGGLVVLGLQGPTLTAYDDAIVPRWNATVPIPAGFPLNLIWLGVDRTGNTLVLLPWFGVPGPLKGVWITAAGQPGPLFDASPRSHGSYVLAPAVEGGFLIRADDCDGSGCTRTWTGRIAALSSRVEPVPAWLAARTGTELRLVHGGAGYGVFGEQLPSCSVEVVAPDGTSCGSADFSALPSEIAGVGQVWEPGPCEASLDIASEGTVTLLRKQRCDPQTGDCTVLWNWFFRYFR